MGRVEQMLGSPGDQRCNCSVYENNYRQDRDIAAPDAEHDWHQQRKIFSLEEPNGKRNQT